MGGRHRRLPHGTFRVWDEGRQRLMSNLDLEEPSVASSQPRYCALSGTAFVIKNEGITDGTTLIAWNKVTELRLIHRKGKLTQIVFIGPEVSGVAKPEDLLQDLDMLTAQLQNVRVRRVYLEPSWPNYLLLIVVVASILGTHRIDWLFIPILIAFIFLFGLRRPRGFRIDDLTWLLALLLSGAYALRRLWGL